MDENELRQKIYSQRKEIRRFERQARQLHKKESVEMNLRDEMNSKLPSGLLPGNVGKYFKVSWPFWYTVEFNFGTNPTYDQATRQIVSFQNTQEASFILGGLSRLSESYSTAGELAPLQLEIKDRQSSRQFNDRGIPWQAIPKKQPEQLLEIPMILLPNAFFDFTMTALPLVNQATVGNGRHVLTMFGYRVRTEDIGEVLSTIWK